MRVAYVAGPYRSPLGSYGVHRNIERAREVAVGLWQMGYCVICPHLNTAHFDGACPDAQWLRGGLELLKRSDFVVLVEGWRESSGTLAEVAEAAELDLPVYEWPNVPKAPE